MANKIEIKNNFNSFKDDFLKDTGLNAKDNIALYTQYVTARFEDKNHQLLWNILNEIANLPNELAFKLGKV